MALKIKDEYFNQILNNISDLSIGFDADGGCACGRLEIELNENLFLSVYRSCRKSSGTPDDKLWHIEEIEFYPKPYDDYEFNEECMAIEIIFDDYQKEVIIDKLREVTKEIWGSEYRSG